MVVRSAADGEVALPAEGEAARERHQPGRGGSPAGGGSGGGVPPERRRKNSMPRWGWVDNLQGRKSGLQSV
nr:unnamed protein product [Digitaria exilis]